MSYIRLNNHIFTFIYTTVFMLVLIACSGDSSTKSSDSTTNSSLDSANPDSTEANNPPDTTLNYLNKDYMMGYLEYSSHPDFILVPKKYADREGLYLRSEILDSFMQMAHAASREGVQLVIRSAARNFDYQRGIWTRKWKDRSEEFPNPVERTLNILRFSSMPGTSRHHWGTEIDLNSFNNSFFEKGGQGEDIYKWLQKNARNYGFYQPYTDKSNGRTGYQEEKWHWSFFPVAKELTEFAADNHHDSLLVGFPGSEYSDSLNIVDNYVLGVE